MKHQNTSGYIFHFQHCLVTFLCAGLLSACGGSGGDDKNETDYASNSSILASSTPTSTYSSASSITAISSSAPSSAITTTSSSSSSSANVVPVVLIDQDINSQDGEYFVASGTVLVGIPNGGNTTFVADEQNKNQFSVYFFANDTTGVSNCNGGCAANWPPLLADENAIAAPPYSIIERSMGTAGTAMQWAYQGKPLYFFAGDTSAGQTNGKAINNWKLARPQPTQALSNATLGSLIGAAGKVKMAKPNNGVEEVTVENRQGFTLYTFDNDTAGVSNCENGCLTNWPALIAHDGAIATAPYSIIERDSGLKQWALHGMPLYFFSGDTQAGQTNGNTVGNNWYVARTASAATINHSTEGHLFVAHGNIVDASGTTDNSRLDFTLYTFDEDPIGESTCNGSCLTTWPALFAPADATSVGDFSVITRTGGAKQWAYKGKALYFFIGDTAPGQFNGEYPTWIIARP